MGFIESVIQTVQTNKRSIVLPEGNEPRNVCAAAEILQKGFAHITLLGDESEIKSVAAKEGVNVDCAQCINPKTAPMLDELVQLVVQLRAHKGMDSAKARDLLTNDVLYFGSALVKAGKVDGIPQPMSCVQHCRLSAQRVIASLFRALWSWRFRNVLLG